MGNKVKVGCVVEKEVVESFNNKLKEENVKVGQFILAAMNSFSDGTYRVVGRELVSTTQTIRK